MVLSNLNHREMWEEGREKKMGGGGEIFYISCCGDGDPHIASQNWSKITQAWAVIPKVQEWVATNPVWTMNFAKRVLWFFNEILNNNFSGKYYF